MNKGNIIHASRVNVKDLDVINIPLLVTTEMLPAFRIVAYYILPWKYRAEVVADSVFVDVEDRCVGSVSSCDVHKKLLTLHDSSTFCLLFNSVSNSASGF